MANATMIQRTNGEAPEGPPAPFIRGSRHRREPFLDRSTVLGASGVSVGPEDVAAFGFMRHILVLVEGTAAGNSADVAFADDGPFGVLSDIGLLDVNGNPIVGPFSGYDAFLAQKYGAYAGGLLDPRQSPAFSVTEGTGGAGGSFRFILRIPVEISGRDALGALANQNAGQTYKLRYTVAPSDQLYDTAPTNAPTVRVRAWLESWTPPRATDLLDNPVAQLPPAHGTLQLWSKYVANISAGHQTVRLPRVGNHLRTLVFVTRDASGDRIATSLPTDLRLTIDGNMLDNVHRDVLSHSIAESYGFDGSVDSPGGLDTGVYVYSFADDLDGRPGYEMRDLYLPTTQGTRLELEGSFGAAGSLEVLTNDVASQGNIYTS